MSVELQANRCILIASIAMSYTIHLVNENYIDKAIIIFGKTINNALEDQDNHNPINKPFQVESILEYLDANLIHFQQIADE